MTNRFAPTLLAFSILALSGCGKHDARTENYTYSMEVNGCKTGEQKADSQVGYCRNLADDEKNNHCAYDERKDAFEANCSGTGVGWPDSDYDSTGGGSTADGG